MCTQADYQLQIKLQDEELAQVHSKLTMKEREHDKIKYEFKQLEGRHQAVKTDFQKVSLCLHLQTGPLIIDSYSAQCISTIILHVRILENYCSDIYIE